MGLVSSLCVMVGVLALASAPALAAGPPVLEEEGSVLSVTSTSAKLQAQINPEGSETTYRFEYGTSEAYESKIPLPDGLVGSGSAGVTVTAEPEGLLPGKTYHYRVVATGSGIADGVDKTFTTQQARGEFSMPDGRQWEMVSPPNKHGAAIYPLDEVGVIEAAEDGSAITYLADAPIELEPKGFTGFYGQVISKRAAQGWSSQVITTPNNAPTNYTPGYGEEYRLFSSDLSLALVEPVAQGFTPLSTEATERTPYIRHDSSCEAAPATCYEPVVTSADVRPGAKFGGESEAYLGEARFVGATPDLSHVLFEDYHAGLTSTPGDEGGLYEWSPSAGGQLQLVSILPESEGGKPASAGGEDPQPGSLQSGRHDISEDGSRVFWSDHSNPERLYLRDHLVKGETLRIGTAGASEFQIANSDGSRVFFIGKKESAETEGTLEVCDVTEVAGKLACKTTALAPEVQGGLPGASEDGSYVYFVSKAKLAANAELNEDNLYVDHNNDTTWGAPQLIATLPEEDNRDWSTDLQDLTVRVSPNGKWLAFMSRKSLTGYDNRDAVSGEPDEEVYLYDAGDGRLVCASCDPTGARPVGMQYGRNGDLFEEGLLGGGDEVWERTTWLAANISGWTKSLGEVTGAHELYQLRYLSNEGRLFFNSDDALVPQDVNGTWDVYEYEPEGIKSPDGKVECSESTSSGSEVFEPEHEFEAQGQKGQAGAGCVGLISSGSSAEQSAFMDASANGDDVFFLTASQLVSQDTDTSFDVYDAHVCSSGVPCVSRPVSPPPCSNGDSCKAAPSPQPAIFGAPASSTFKGTGDVAASSVPGVAPKSLTRAQMLARALRACEKKPKKKRGACKRQARKRYRAVQSRKATSTKRRAHR